MTETVTSEAVESLADAEPEPWSVQAVERAEAVADDALAETKLAFPMASRGHGRLRVTRRRRLPDARHRPFKD